MPYEPKAPSEGASLILQTAGVGVIAANSGWRIGTGKMIDKPDTQIVSFDAPGQQHDPKWLLDYSVVQVMVRAAPDGYNVGYRKMRDCVDALLGIDAMTVNGDRWDGITTLGTASHIGYDENGRPMFSCNFRIILEPAASSLTHREPL